LFCGRREQRSVCAGSKTYRGIRMKTKFISTLLLSGATALLIGCNQNNPPPGPAPAEAPAAVPVPVPVPEPVPGPPGTPGAPGAEGAPGAPGAPAPAPA